MAPTAWQSRFCIVSCQMAVIMNVAALSIALPYLAEELTTPIETLIWVSVGPMMISAMLTPGAGKLADMYGRRKIWLIGFTITIVANICCALSRNAMMLIAARMLLGLGEALDQPSGIVLVTGTFKQGQFGMALGVVNAINTATPAIGAVGGALMVQKFGWRALFYLPLPLMILMWALSLYFVREFRNGELYEPRKKNKQDIGITTENDAKQFQDDVGLLGSGGGDDDDVGHDEEGGEGRPSGDLVLDDLTLAKDAYSSCSSTFSPFSPRDLPTPKAPGEVQDKSSMPSPTKSRVSDHPEDLTWRDFDIKGLLLFSIGIFCVLFGINRASLWGWFHPAVLSVSGVGVVVLLLFGWVECRVASPIIAPWYISDFFRFGTLLAFGGQSFAYMGMFALIPVFLEDAHGWTLARSAQLIFFRPCFNAIANFIAGPLSDRVNLNILFLFFGILSWFSYGIFPFVIDTANPWAVGTALGLQGAGPGALWCVMTVQITKYTPEKDRSNLMGVLSFTDQAVSLIAIALSLSMASSMGGVSDARAYRVPFVVCFLVCVVSTLFIFLTQIHARRQAKRVAEGLESVELKEVEE